MRTLTMAVAVAALASLLPVIPAGAQGPPPVVPQTRPLPRR